MRGVVTSKQTFLFRSHAPFPSRLAGITMRREVFYFEPERAYKLQEGSRFDS